jgi:hypothetical protein
MHKDKKTNLGLQYLSFVGEIVLLALLSSAGLYAPSFEAQQSATIVIASSNENMTTGPGSGAPNTSAASIANGTTTGSMPNATLVEFVSNIEQIRGHLYEAIPNKES